MKKIPVTVRGVLYPSQAAAARALGICRQGITQALQIGDINKVGLRPYTHKSKPITVNGVRYLSIQKAAKATNTPYSTLQSRVTAGKYKVG